MKKDLIQYVEDNFVTTKEFPKFKAGDTITVSYRIVEGSKERIQQFQGVVLQITGSGVTKTFTVRKISSTHFLPAQPHRQESTYQREEKLIFLCSLYRKSRFERAAFFFTDFCIFNILSKKSFFCLSYHKSG